MKIILAILASAAIAALVTFPVQAKRKPALHWHYGNCNVIVTVCDIG